MEFTIFYILLFNKREIIGYFSFPSTGVSPQEKQVTLEISDLHTHCVTLLMHCVQQVEMSNRMSVLSPPPLTDTQHKLIRLCVSAAHPNAEDLQKLAATAEQRISETLVCLERLRVATVELRKALENQKLDRGKGCMGHNGLAFSFIQILLLYLQVAIRELVHSEYKRICNCCRDINILDDNQAQDSSLAIHCRSRCRI